MVKGRLVATRPTPTHREKAQDSVALGARSVSALGTVRLRHCPENGLVRVALCPEGPVLFEVGLTYLHRVFFLLLFFSFSLPDISQSFRSEKENNSLN